MPIIVKTQSIIFQLINSLRSRRANKVNQRVASDKTHCKPFDLGNLSSGYLDRPMYANHTISLEYTLLRRVLFFNSEVSGFQYVRENQAEELN